MVFKLSCAFSAGSHLRKALCFIGFFLLLVMSLINECTFVTLLWGWRVLTYQEIKWLAKDNNACLYQSQLWLHAVLHPQPSFLVHEYCQIISVFQHITLHFLRLVLPLFWWLLWIGKMRCQIKKYTDQIAWSVAEPSQKTQEEMNSCSQLGYHWL